MPVPQPDVLKRSLIVSRFGRLTGGLSRKLALRDSVQSVGLPRQIGVVYNVGPLANQFVRFDDKAADVPGDGLNTEITNCGRKDRPDQPATPPHSHSVDQGDPCTRSGRDAD